MPLYNRTVTIASRLMLPTHIVLSLWIGLPWMLQDSERTHTAALSVLRSAPIQVSGAVLVLLGVGELLARFVLHNRALTATFLGAGMIVFAVLGVFIAIATITAHASYSAPAWPWYVVMAHLATLLSLAHDELTDTDGNHRRAGA